MYQIVQKNGKLHIQNDNGELIEENGIAIWFAGPIAANRALAQLNSGKQLSTTLVRGVVDNRHRNWRTRRR